MTVHTIMGLPDLVIAADGAGSIQYLNSAAEAHFGTQRAIAAGKPLGSLRSADLDGALLEDAVRQARGTGGAAELEVSPRSPGGKTWRVKANVSPSAVQL